MSTSRLWLRTPDLRKAMCRLVVYGTCSHALLLGSRVKVNGGRRQRRKPLDIPTLEQHLHRRTSGLGRLCAGLACICLMLSVNVCCNSNFQIQGLTKSAARAACRKTKIQGSAPIRQLRVPGGSSAPLDFGLPGGCASSRLDQGLTPCVTL